MLTSSPIRAILYKPDVSGRLLKWAVELSEFDIEYRPRTTIKGQLESKNGCWRRMDHPGPKVEALE